LTDAVVSIYHHQIGGFESSETLLKKAAKKAAKKATKKEDRWQIAHR